jgi:hypothetical protein
LDKEAEKLPYFKLISEKTKIKPAYILLSLLLIALLIVLMGICESAVSRVIGVVYPAIKSI